LLWDFHLIVLRAKEADSGQHDLETELEHVQILGERAQSSQIAVTSKSSRAINSSKFFEPVAKTAKAAMEEMTPTGADVRTSRRAWRTP